MVILDKRISRKVTFRFSNQSTAGESHLEYIIFSNYNCQIDVSILILDEIRKPKSFVEYSLRFFNHVWNLMIIIWGGVK